MAFDYQQAWTSALDISAYWQQFQEKLENPLPDDPYAPYLPLNWQRVQRILKQFNASGEWISWSRDSSTTAYWLVITEPWCGDAAQILPVLDRLAQISQEKISLRTLYRDQHLDLMDLHLTQGSRSIPKILCLSSDFELIGSWGPRPEAAQALRSSYPEDPKGYADALHLWYGRNRQVIIQEEILAWMKSII